MINFSDRVKDLHASAIRESFKALSRPGVISLAGGMPARNIPERELAEIMKEILIDSPAKALQRDTRGMRRP